MPVITRCPGSSKVCRDCAETVVPPCWSGGKFKLCVLGYGSTEKVAQIYWGSEGLLGGGILKLGFDGCIGVLEFSKGGSSFWEWKLYMQRLKAGTGDCVSREQQVLWST